MEKSARRCCVCGYASGNLIAHLTVKAGKVSRVYYHAPETSPACFAVYESDTADEVLF